MNHKYILLAILLIVPLSSAMALMPPKVEEVEFSHSSGALPPQYQWHKTLVATPDFTKMTLKVKYDVVNGVKGKDVHVVKVLSDSWHREFMHFFADPQICGLGEEPKEMLVGGQELAITIKGIGIELFVKKGHAPENGEMLLFERNDCSKDKIFWNSLWGFFDKVVQEVTSK